MGFILGGFIYAVMQTGFISLYGGGGNTLEITSTPWIIFVLALIVGYQQNVAWDLMRRIIKVMFQIDSKGNRSE